MNAILDVREFSDETQQRNVDNLLSILQIGDSFILLNSRDPKTLLGKIKEDVLRNIRLEYLEQGPINWRLKLTRLSDSKKKEGCCGSCGG